jgi:hypothetical protein
MGRWSKRKRACLQNAEKSRGRHKKGPEWYEKKVETIKEPRNKDGVVFRRCCHQYENGDFCKNEQIYELCDIHAIKDRKVKVCNSLIDPSFLGLFAYNGIYDSEEIVFKKNDLIFEYEGIVMTKMEIDQLYPDEQPSYVVQISKDIFIDCVDHRCLAAMINTSRYTNGRFKSNCRFSVSPANKTCKIVATRNIYNCEEILNSYYLPKHVIINLL